MLFRSGTTTAALRRYQPGKKSVYYVKAGIKIGHERIASVSVGITAIRIERYCCKPYCNEPLRDCFSAHTDWQCIIGYDISADKREIPCREREQGFPVAIAGIILVNGQAVTIRAAFSRYLCNAIIGREDAFSTNCWYRVHNRRCNDRSAKTKQPQ